MAAPQRALFILYLVIAYHLPAKAGDTPVITGSKNQPTITLTIDTGQANALNTNLQQRACQLLCLHLASNNGTLLPAVQGQYRLDKNKLSFTPLYPLGEGLTFEIWYKTVNGIAMQKYCTVRPGQDSSRARAIQVYPMADTLPENILAFHIRFSEPMNADSKAYMHINVYNEDEQLLDRVWRQRSYWTDSNRLLVLMIHPGRVKSGIHYIGPVFVKDKRYRIALNGCLSDNNGLPAAVHISKTFVMAGEDRQLPTLKGVTTRNNNQGKEVIVSFSESMDMGTVSGGLLLLDNNGKVIPAIIRETGDDKTFMIVPHKKLPEGTYTIQLHKTVCDVAANRMTRPFEITQLSQKESEPDFVRLGFEIK